MTFSNHWIARELARLYYNRHRRMPDPLRVVFGSETIDIRAGAEYRKEPELAIRFDRSLTGVRSVEHVRLMLDEIIPGPNPRDHFFAFLNMVDTLDHE